MSDIIERLTELSNLMMDGRPYNDSDFTDIDEAINEIVRLRNEVDTHINMSNTQSEKVLKLTAERDEARCEFCLWKGAVKGIRREKIAEEKGWDCFKENTNG